MQNRQLTNQTQTTVSSDLIHCQFANLQMRILPPYKEGKLRLSVRWSHRTAQLCNPSRIWWKDCDALGWERAQNDCVIDTSYIAVHIINCVWKSNFFIVPVIHSTLQTSTAQCKQDIKTPVTLYFYFTLDDWVVFSWYRDFVYLSWPHICMNVYV